MPKESNAERAFVGLWSMFEELEQYILIREHVFDPSRKWRFDFAVVAQKVAVEIEGGVWSGGRHTRGAGFQEDCIKYNRAVELGWKVLRYTPQMIEDDPMMIINQIFSILRSLPE